jgi:hypothetical protein
LSVDKQDEVSVSRGIYRHYKGGLYTVLMIARNSETEEEMVVYISDKTQSLWVRPAKMWNEEVELNGKKCKRFALYPSGDSYRQKDATDFTNRKV